MILDYTEDSLTLLCRSRGTPQGRLLCPKLLVVKTEAREDEGRRGPQESTGGPQGGPRLAGGPGGPRLAGGPGGQETGKQHSRASNRRVLESCLLSSNKVKLSLT